MIGKNLAHYRILKKIGEGGMGVAYAAEDKRLKRRIALKVLPADLADDPQRLERFQCEAEALASLNHPNIVTVYSVEEAEGLQFLTMELVSGQPLDQTIPKGGLDLEAFFATALPLADALSSAHEVNITHRT